MSVRVFREGAEYVAIDSETDAVGFGETEEDARQECDLDNRECYDRLKLLADDRLGPHMVAIKRILERRAAGVGA